MAALHECIDFAGNSDLPGDWQDDVYRYCTFTGLDVEGDALTGVLIGCKVKDCSWYWGLFNTTTFVRVEFNRCVFQAESGNCRQ
jgi:hypothetical protein